jgi:hypothetical protein
VSNHGDHTGVIGHSVLVTFKDTVSAGSMLPQS